MSLSFLMPTNAMRVPGISCIGRADIFRECVVVPRNAGIAFIDEGWGRATSLCAEKGSCGWSKSANCRHAVQQIDVSSVIPRALATTSWLVQPGCLSMRSSPCRPP